MATLASQLELPDVDVRSVDEACDHGADLYAALEESDKLSPVPE